MSDPALVPDVLRAHERRLEARLTRVRGDLHEIHHLRADEGVPTVSEEMLDHRRLAASLHNGTWEYLEKEDRTPDDDDRMVHMAHASCHHWRQVGTSANFARGEWLCSRVYSALRRPEPALHHAQRARARRPGDRPRAAPLLVILRPGHPAGRPSQR